MYLVMYRFLLFVMIYSWFWWLIVVEWIGFDCGFLKYILCLCFSFGFIMIIFESNEFDFIIIFLKLFIDVFDEYVFLIWILLIGIDEM